MLYIYVAARAVIYFTFSIPLLIITVFVIYPIFLLSGKKINSKQLFDALYSPNTEYTYQENFSAPSLVAPVTCALVFWPIIQFVQILGLEDDWVYILFIVVSVVFGLFLLTHFTTSEKDLNFYLAHLLELNNREYFKLVILASIPTSLGIVAVWDIMIDLLSVLT